MIESSKDLSALPSILVGVSGEYFVAAELSRQGYVASITLRNTRGIDILATNQEATRSVAIQVKTNRGKKKDWMLNEKAEEYHSENFFYVFVNLGGEAQRPEYHVVPSAVVANYVKSTHRQWLNTPNRTGGDHKDTSMRHFKDEDNEYLDKWELLGL